MTKMYNIGGMSCDGCKSTVKKALTKVEGVKSVILDLTRSEAVLKFDKPVSVIELQEALSEAGLFFIVEKAGMDQNHIELTGKKKISPFFRRFLRMFC